MAYDKVNNTTHANLTKINNVPKATIAKVNNVDAPAGTTAASFHSGRTSWAAHADIADVTEWEGNTWDTKGSSDSVELLDIAYGKDNSGNPIFLAITNASGNNTWVDQNNDITDSSAWTRINLADTAKRRTIQWGNDVWVAAGEMGNTRIHRSTDGAANFTSVDVSGLDNIVTGTKVTGLASDGAGNWMMGQKENLYFSSDDAATWAFLVQPAGTGHEIRDIVYTNSTWVVLFDGDYNDGSGGGPDGTVDDDAYVITCPASTAANMDAVSDWGTAQQLAAANQVDAAGNSTATASHLDGSLTMRMAAAGGRVVFLQSGSASANMAKTQAADVSGKTCTLEDTIVIVPLVEGAANCIATDGHGTWLIGGDGGNIGDDGGNIARSTNNGDAWTLIVEAITSTNRKINGITPDKYLPL